MVEYCMNKEEAYNIIATLISSCVSREYGNFTESFTEAGYPELSKLYNLFMDGKITLTEFDNKAVSYVVAKHSKLGQALL